MGLRRLEFIGLFFCKSLTTLEITENCGFKCRPDEEGIETRASVDRKKANTVSNADLMKKGLKQESIQIQRQRSLFQMQT